MRTSEFIRRLETSTQSVFSLSDFTRILGKREAYTKVFIHRLTKKELLRLEKNKYTLKGLNPLLVASSIIFPSYISFLSAYSYYGLTTQLPRAIYVVSLKQKKPLSYDENPIFFVKFKKTRFFGFRRESLEKKFLFVAEVEKAIVDSLYLPKYCSISETLFAIKNASLDVKKLIDYAKRMESVALKARLGYLLELANISIEKEKLEPLPRNYIPLNPSLPKKGKREERWKLVVNEVLE